MQKYKHLKLAKVYRSFLISLLILVSTSFFLFSKENSKGFFANDVTVHNDCLFVACAQGGVRIYNIKNPNAPELVSIIKDDFPAYQVQVIGEKLYVACLDKGFRIYNINILKAPVLDAKIENGVNVMRFCIVGNYAYLVCRSQGVKIYDVSPSKIPKLVKTLSHKGVDSLHIAKNDKYIFLANNKEGLWVYSINSPSRPKLEFKLKNTNAEKVEVEGNSCFVVNGIDGVSVFKLKQGRTTIALAPVVTIGKGKIPNNIKVLKTTIWVANGGTGAHVYKITDVGDYESVSEISIGGQMACNFAIDKDIMFLATSDGVRIYDVGSIEAPKLVSSIPISE